MSEHLRLFVAIDIPEEHLTRLDEAAAPLKKRFPSGRWAPVGNQHVTLKFLGSTESDNLDAIVTASQKVASALSPAEIALGSVGHFPGGRRLRVLWVGLEDPAELTPRAAAGLDEVLEPLGFEPEKRAFTPHLTLARFKVPEKLAEPLELKDIPSEPFPLEELVLYRSHLSPKGARYEALSRFRLGGITAQPRPGGPNL